MRKYLVFVFVLGFICMAATCNNVTPSNDCIDKTGQFTEPSVFIDTIDQNIYDVATSVYVGRFGKYAYVLDNSNTRGFNSSNPFYGKFGKVCYMYIDNNMQLQAMPVNPECCHYYFSLPETKAGNGLYDSYLQWCCSCGNKWYRYDIIR